MTTLFQLGNVFGGFSEQPIPLAIQQQMIGSTWHKDCPVPLSDLRLLTIQYRDLNADIQQGKLIVHQQVATEVLSIFKKLFTLNYPIERMQLMSEFGGDDEKAMEVNNTSAFNCRAITGHNKHFSKHSYGLAIDLNTRINPYIKGATILPKNASEFINRQQHLPGMIHHGDSTYQLFIQRHWQWGGDWKSLKDYQHFEKDIASYGY